MDFLLNDNNLLLVLVAVTSGVMLMLPKLLKSGAKNLSITQAVQMTNQKDGVFVDVRSPEAFKAGSIPNARNLPAADVLTRSGALPKDKPLIVFCEQGRSSVRVAATLRKQGHAEVYNLEGGLTAWLQAGMPLSRKS